MNGRLLIAAVVILALLGACTPTIYGVPEATWQQMSEPERVAAIEAYRQRQIALQQAQAERARQRAIEQEAARQRQAEAERLRQRQIDAIHRGQGVYGDLLQVTLSDGMINFSGRHQTYPPMTFRIAQGETRDITVTDYKGRRRPVRVSYSDGNLVLDSRGAKPNQVARYTFGPTWEEGISFPPVETKGDAELRGVRVTVNVLGEPPHRRQHHREVAPAPAQPPQVIVVQAPPPPAPQIVVVEQPNHRPPRREERHGERRQPPSPPVATAPAPGLPTPPAPLTRIEPAQPEHRQPARQEPQRQHPDRPTPPPAPPVVSAPPPTVVVVPPPHRSQPEVQRPEAQRPEARNPETRTPPVVAAEAQVPQRILVRFHNGLVKIKGKYHPFTPVEIRLAAGETQSITLQSAGGALRVTLSYQGGRLVLDPDEPGAKGRSQHAFTAEKGWALGRSYRFDAPGNRLLKQVDLEVVGDHSG